MIALHRVHRDLKTVFLRLGHHRKEKIKEQLQLPWCKYCNHPQEGQNGVDKGGWKMTKGDLVKNGSTSLEYQSGIGPFAFLFNFGKPFIDVLEIKITNSNTVQLRSSSRIGKSDLGVNQKRLLYLGQKAKELGWDIPEPKY